MKMGHKKKKNMMNILKLTETTIISACDLSLYAATRLDINIDDKVAKVGIGT